MSQGNLDPFFFSLSVTPDIVGIIKGGTRVEDEVTDHKSFYRRVSSGWGLCLRIMVLTVSLNPL